MSTLCPTQSNSIVEPAGQFFNPLRYNYIRNRRQDTICFGTPIIEPILDHDPVRSTGFGESLATFFGQPTGLSAKKM